jgi:hypothetical protein
VRLHLGTCRTSLQEAAPRARTSRAPPAHQGSSAAAFSITAAAAARVLVGMGTMSVTCGAQQAGGGVRSVTALDTVSTTLRQTATWVMSLPGSAGQECVHQWHRPPEPQMLL